MPDTKRNTKLLAAIIGSGLSMNDFNERITMSRSTMTKLLNYQKSPTADEMLELAEVLSVPINQVETLGFYDNNIIYNKSVND